MTEYTFTGTVRHMAVRPLRAVARWYREVWADTLALCAAGRSQRPAVPPGPPPRPPREAP